MPGSFARYVSLPHTQTVARCLNNDESSFVLVTFAKPNHDGPLIACSAIKMAVPCLYILDISPIAFYPSLMSVSIE
jgi:hypothetical protein